MNAQATQTRQERTHTLPKGAHAMKAHKGAPVPSGVAQEATKMTHAVAQATKDMQDTVAAIKKAAQPTKLYTTEDLAKHTGMSISYIYAAIAKQKPQALAKEGHKLLYPQSFLDHLIALPSQPRIRRIKTIAPRAHVERVVQVAPVQVQQQAPLMQRLSHIEEQLETVTKALTTINKFLGL